MHQSTLTLFKVAMVPRQTKQLLLHWPTFLVWLAPKRSFVKVGEKVTGMGECPVLRHRPQEVVPLEDALERARKTRLGLCVKAFLSSTPEMRLEAARLFCLSLDSALEVGAEEVERSGVGAEVLDAAVQLVFSTNWQETAYGCQILGLLFESRVFPDCLQSTAVQKYLEAVPSLVERESESIKRYVIHGLGCLLCYEGGESVLRALPPHEIYRQLKQEVTDEGLFAEIVSYFCQYAEVCHEFAVGMVSSVSKDGMNSLNDRAKTHAVGIIRVLLRRFELKKVDKLLAYFVDRVENAGQGSLDAFGDVVIDAGEKGWDILSVPHGALQTILRSKSNHAIACVLFLLGKNAERMSMEEAESIFPAVKEAVRGKSLMVALYGAGAVAGLVMKCSEEVVKKEVAGGLFSFLMRCFSSPYGGVQKTAVEAVQGIFERASRNEWLDECCRCFEDGEWIPVLQDHVELNGRYSAEINEFLSKHFMAVDANRG